MERGKNTTQKKDDNYVLTPNRYLGTEGTQNDDAPFKELHHQRYLWHTVAEADVGQDLSEG